MLHGFGIDPDLDLESLNRSEALWIKLIVFIPLIGWSTFYARIFQKWGGHRSIWTHGFKVNEAWVRFKEFINQHHKNGDKSVVIITGRNGQIAREFSNWCSNIQAIREWEPLSRRNGIAGSFRVYLKQRIRKEA